MNQGNRGVLCGSIFYSLLALFFDQLLATLRCLVARRRAQQALVLKGQLNLARDIVQLLEEHLVLLESLNHLVFHIWSL